jgi:hypothetical protein
MALLHLFDNAVHNFKQTAEDARLVGEFVAEGNCRSAAHNMRDMMQNFGRGRAYLASWWDAERTPEHREHDKSNLYTLDEMQTSALHAGRAAIDAFDAKCLRKR